MTKQEFYDYIKSFNKKAGYYTVDEMAEIGLKHKTLELKDKNWQELADLLGWIGSKDSFRAFVNRRAILGRDSDAFLAESDRLYIAKTQVRDTYNAFRNSLRDEARLEDLKQAIRDSVSMLNDLPKVSLKKESKEELSGAELVIPFADLHLGPDFTNSINSYSYEIAVKRVNKILEEVKDYCKLHRVKTIHFLGMGDYISGIIHETLRYNQRLDVIDQTMKAAELISEFLNQLQPLATRITYRSVVDNHSRINADKNKSIEAENLCRIVDWFVEERLKASNIMFMKDNIDIGIGKFTLDNGKVIMFSHGHQDGKQKVFQDMVGLTKQVPDYIIMAHYHNSAEHTFQGAKVFVCGSIIGTDPYAYGRRLFGDPEQKILIFERDNIVDININLK